MDFIFFISSLILSFVLLIQGTLAETCYNMYYSETYECKYGCCGGKYDYDYGCCTITGIVAGAVFGFIFIVGVIIVLVYVCKKKNQPGRVINPAPTTNRVTVVQPPAYQPHPQGPPPSYPGPPAGGSGFQPGHQQMYPPPPPLQNGPGIDPAYPPKY